MPGHSENTSNPERQDIDLSKGKVHDPRDSSTSDHILSLMEKVDQFQRRMARPLPDAAPAAGHDGPPVSASHDPDAGAARRGAGETRDDNYPLAALRAGQMKRHYSALAALLLERYREMQDRYAAHPQIASLLEALRHIRDLVGHLEREAPYLATSPGAHVPEVLREVSKACSALILELQEEPPLPPPADSLDPGRGMDTAVLRRMADYLIRHRQFPTLFMDPEALYLERLRKALTLALTDYNKRLEAHQHKCSPEPEAFHKRFENFTRLRLIPSLVSHLEEACRKLPDHAPHIQRIMERIKELAVVPRHLSAKRENAADEPR